MVGETVREANRKHTMEGERGNDESTDKLMCGYTNMYWNENEWRDVKKPQAESACQVITTKRGEGQILDWVTKTFWQSYLNELLP